MISFGTLSIEQFVKTYWQKKPLLVRNALANANSFISTQDLLAFSSEDQCESRLITRRRNNKAPAKALLCDVWSLEHGPFASLPRKGFWTVLLQGMDTHHPKINSLLNQFRFVGDALLDDVMISYASDGGGVGPHVDSYDVFLIQLHGRRQWQISSPAQTPGIFQEGSPVKILAEFFPSQQWLLEQGDMLYLPAGWGHDGVAQGACVTASVGYRAPHRKEWLSALIDDLADDVEDILPDDGPRYKSKNATPTPGLLNDDLIAQTSAWAGELLSEQAPLGTRLREKAVEFSGRYFTEPKSSTVFQSPSKKWSIPAFSKQIARQGLQLHIASRALYLEKPSMFFINGESFNLNRKQLAPLAKLANNKSLSTTDCEKLDQDLIESLAQWMESGWLVFSK
jgi:50S ribosomal protein L16 3-hydroxylase